MTTTAASTGSVQLNMSIQSISISISISASISTSTATATLTASSASREFWRFPRTERVFQPPAILDMHTNTYYTYEHSEGGSSSRGAGVSLACPTNCKYLQTAAGKQICVRFLWLLLLLFFLFLFLFFLLCLFTTVRGICLSFTLCRLCPARAIGNTRALRLLILHKNLAQAFSSRHAICSRRRRRRSRRTRATISDTNVTTGMLLDM